MKINLGIAPIAWSNDDMPELGGDTPIETCLYEAKSAGYSGIELGGKFPRNPGTIKYLINKFNLSLPGGWYGSKLKEKSIEEEWQAMQGQIELLKLVKSSVFRYLSTRWFLFINFQILHCQQDVVYDCSDVSTYLYLRSKSTLNQTQQ